MGVLQKSVRPFWRWIRPASLLVYPALVGCSSLTYVAFPDPARTKQANTVQTDFKAVDLNAAAAAAPALLHAQLDAMHAEQDRFSQVQTQAAVATFVDAPLDGQKETPTGVVHLGLRTRDEQLLLRLAATSHGKPLPDVAQLVEKLGAYDAKLAARDTSLQAQQSNYTRFHLGSIPSCADVPGSESGHYEQHIADALALLTNDNDRATAVSTLEFIRSTVCAVLADADFDQVYEGKGLIATAHKRLLAAQDRRIKDAAAADAQGLVVDQAQKEYNDAAEAAAGSSTPASDRVSVRADKLVKAIQGLQGLSQKTGGRSDKLLAGLNLAAANTQLGDISAGLSSGQLPDGTKDFSAAIVLATRLVDAQHPIDTALVQSEKIPAQLVLAQESLQLQQAQATVSAQDQRINLLQQLEATLWEEFKNLSFSETQIDLALTNAKQLAGPGPWAKVIASDAADCNPADKISADPSRQTYEQMFCVNPPTVRVALVLAASYYVAAQGRLQAQRRKLEYDLINIDDELSVTYSAINLQRWNALLAPIVNEVVTFNTLDSNTVSLAAQLLQLVGLAYIGHGVNK